jgi:Ni,Fe-hydrogenase III large subunit
MRATAGRVNLQMTGRALISLNVNDADAMAASFDPCLPDPRRVLPSLARS